MKKHSHFHDDEEAFVVVVGVLVDVLEVDDVLAAAGAPVEIDLTSEKEI